MSPRHRLMVTPEQRGHGGGISTFYRRLAPAIAAARWRVTMVEGSGFGLLHLPYILERAGTVVVQCHSGWGQIGLYELTGGKEFDQALALAIETEGLPYAAARHTYANAKASWLLDCPHGGFIVWGRSILDFWQKLKNCDSEAMAIAVPKYMAGKQRDAEIRQRVNGLILEHSSPGYRQ